MSKTLAFARLDWLTVKAFWNVKTLLLMVAVFAITSVGTGSPALLVVMMLMCGILYSTMPFAVGEQNGIDALYATLPLARRQVVAGRYLYVLGLNLTVAAAGVLLGVVMAGGVSLFAPGRFAFDLRDLPLLAAGGLLAVGLIVAVQLPVCFRVGYAKAKLFIYLPFVVYSAAILVLSQLMGVQRVNEVVKAAAGWASAHMVLTVLLAALFLAAALSLSMLLSIRFYRRREF